MQAQSMLPQVLSLIARQSIELPVLAPEVEDFTEAVERSVSLQPRNNLSDDEADDALMTLAIYANLSLWNTEVPTSTKARLVRALTIIFRTDTLIGFDSYQLFWDTVCRPSEGARTEEVRGLLAEALVASSDRPESKRAVELGAARLAGH